METTHEHPIVTVNAPDKVRGPSFQIMRRSRMQGWGFRVAATGAYLSIAALLGGTVWNQTDPFSHQDIIDKCDEQGFTEPYVRGLMTSIDSGVIGEVTDKDKIEIGKGSGVNVPIGDIRQCLQTYDEQVTFVAEHPSRNVIVGGIAGLMAFGPLAASIKPRDRFGSRTRSF